MVEVYFASTLADELHPCRQLLLNYEKAAQLMDHQELTISSETVTLDAIKGGAYKIVSMAPTMLHHGFMSACLSTGLVRVICIYANACTARLIDDIFACTTGGRHNLRISHQLTPTLLAHSSLPPTSFPPPALVDYLFVKLRQPEAGVATVFLDYMRVDATPEVTKTLRTPLTRVDKIGMTREFYLAHEIPAPPMLTELSIADAAFNQRVRVNRAIMILREPCVFSAVPVDLWRLLVGMLCHIPSRAE